MANFLSFCLQAEAFQKTVQTELAEAKVVQKYNAQLHKDLQREQLARKKLHNDMEDMKGTAQFFYFLFLCTFLGPRSVWYCSHVPIVLTSLTPLSFFLSVPWCDLSSYFFSFIVTVGKIRVYVRVRPFSKSELAKNCEESVVKDGKMTVLVKGLGTPDAKKYYDFDQVMIFM